jgi:hypothetical protein
MLTSTGLVTRYRIDCDGSQYADEAFRSAWRSLLSTSTSPEPIYQSPEFFEVLRETTDDRDNLALLSIREVETDELVGVVPIRRMTVSLTFPLGSRSLGSVKLQAIILLGSVPLIPLDGDVFGQLCIYLLNRYPQCNAISMLALPRESEFHRHIKQSPALRTKLISYVRDGWRESHAIPLPESFDHYLRQFSSKKRFNLKRQIRLLKEHVDGDLYLRKITSPEEVPGFFGALKTIATPELLEKLISERSLLELSKQGLLHSYLLTSAQKALAIIVATRSKHVLHISNILYPPEIENISVGVSLLHMAIEDLIKNPDFRSIDLGYSNPAQYSSKNKVELRGHMLLIRRNISNYILVFAHHSYANILERAKILRRRLKNLRGRLSTRHSNI